MDREYWHAALRVSQRVVHDLATEQQNTKTDIIKKKKKKFNMTSSYSFL